MINPEVVGARFSVDVQASGRLKHLCPHKDEVDYGQITIKWRCCGNTIELHSLRAYLDQWADAKISHEDLTERIRSEIRALPGLVNVEVETRWKTADMDVICSI